ncbi:MAG: PqqD family protein [Acidobacteriota bacterium]|nr:MAG: PqqD family protein [Acidobacteriota bacterium]
MIEFPQARVDVKVVDLGSELLIIDDRRRRFHFLNSTARRIWDLCDGTHSRNEIEAEIARLFPATPVERVRHDVDKALEELEREEVIVWVAAELPRPKEA